MPKRVSTTPLRLAKLPAHRDVVGSDKIEELIWWVKGKNKHFERPMIGGRRRNESRRRGDRGCAVRLGHVEAGRALLGIRWGDQDSGRLQIWRGLVIGMRLLQLTMLLEFGICGHEEFNCWWIPGGISTAPSIDKQANRRRVRRGGGEESASMRVQALSGVYAPWNIKTPSETQARPSTNQ
jgi:hypothetical protein